jgi:type IV pilus assembly protein PilB
MAIDANVDLDLGAILLEKKMVTEEQLKEASQRHRIRGGYLSQHLIELGHIKDADLTTYLTCQYGFCYLPIQSYNIDETALGTIPVNIVYDYCVLPIEKNDRLLTVVMADPLNKGVIESLRQTTQCEIVVFICTRHEIKDAVEKNYGKTFKEFDLDRYTNDAQLRDNIGEKSFIRTDNYTGPNRRRYIRKNVEVPIEYYLYPNSIKAKTQNVSVNGMFFSSVLPLAKGSQIALNIQLDNACVITGVLEVARCESKHMEKTIYESKSSGLYEVGGFFNFISPSDHELLAQFLKKLPSN